MAITYDDLQGAMNLLRGEIPGLIAPSIAGLRIEIDNTVGAALLEIRQQSTATAQQVTSAVTEQFQSASIGLHEEQDRLNGILHEEHNRLTVLLGQQQSVLDQLIIDGTASVEKVSCHRRQAQRSRECPHRLEGHNGGLQD